MLPPGKNSADTHANKLLANIYRLVIAHRFFSDTKLGVMKMPPAIEYSVRKQNIKFMHHRNQFSAEYFQFIKKLVSCNPHNINRQNLNEKLVSCMTIYKIDTHTHFLNTLFSFNKHRIFLESRSRRACDAVGSISIQISLLYGLSY